MKLTHQHIRVPLALCLTLVFATLFTGASQARNEMPSSTRIEVQTLVPDGLPLGFSFATLTSDPAFDGRGYLHYRVTSSVSLELTSLELGYVVVGADGAVRSGGFEVGRATIVANSWLEAWTLLQSELRAGDRVVVTLNGATSEAVRWQADRVAMADAAKALATGGTVSIPVARRSATT